MFDNLMIPLNLFASDDKKHVIFKIMQRAYKRTASLIVSSPEGHSWKVLCDGSFNFKWTGDYTVP